MSRPTRPPSARPRCATPALHLAALGAVTAVTLTACGDSPAAPDYGYVAPGDVLEDRAAFEENRKELAAARGTEPRELAERLGCAGYSPVLADRVGEIVGTCRLLGQQLRLVSFADGEARAAYLETHRDESIYVVWDLWAVRAPTQALAQQVQQRLGVA